MGDLCCIVSSLVPSSQSEVKIKSLLTGGGGWANKSFNFSFLQPNQRNIFHPFDGKLLRIAEIT